ncbi:MAG: substrate-binding domain-containing protein [Planctomycetales bacterium]
MNHQFFSRRSLFRLATTACAGLVLLGCGGTDSGSGTGNGTGGVRNVDAKDARYIILTNGNSPFWDAVRVGMTKAGEEMKINVDIENCDGTPRDQLDKQRHFKRQPDVVAIGISALTAKSPALADELREIQKQGVKVVTIDSDVDREKFSDARFGFVGTNNLVAGEELGKAAKALKPEGGKYVAFVGYSDAQNAIDRIGGFATGAGESFVKADVMTDETDRSKALANVRNAVNDPDVNVLVGIWSYNAPAIADLVKEQDSKSKYTVVTFDAEPLAIKQMEKGLIDAMIVQNPYQMGYQGARLMKALVEEDQDEIKKMLPNTGEPDGNIYDTGLKVVVPNEGSPLKPEMFGESVEFFKLSDFQAWLEERELTGS